MTNKKHCSKCARSVGGYVKFVNGSVHVFCEPCQFDVTANVARKAIRTRRENKKFFTSFIKVFRAVSA